MTIDRITVISLERTPERFAQFLSLNPGLAVERFTAVDGRTLDRDACVAEGLITPDNQYSTAALGCAFSHVGLWRRCASEDRVLCIAEDDAILRQDFRVMAASVLAKLPAWDMVLWSWNFDWPLKLKLAPGLGATALFCDQAALRAEWPIFPKITTTPLLAALISAAGSSCYSLTPRGARRLLDLCLPFGNLPAPYALKPKIPWINTSFDVELSRHYQKLAAFVALPCLAISLNDHMRSTIAGPS